MGTRLVGKVGRLKLPLQIFLIDLLILKSSFLSGASKHRSQHVIGNPQSASAPLHLLVHPQYRPPNLDKQSCPLVGKGRHYILQENNHLSGLLKQVAWENNSGLLQTGLVVESCCNDIEWQHVHQPPVYKHHPSADT